MANARKESQIRSPSSDYFLELDVWIPTLNLGFEFQDEHHFMTTWYYNRPLQLISQRDCIRLHSCSFYLILFLFFTFYISTLIFHNSILLLQMVSFKQEIVGKTGVTLVHVPCWWDGNAERYSQHPL